MAKKCKCGGPLRSPQDVAIFLRREIGRAKHASDAMPYPDGMPTALGRMLAVAQLAASELEGTCPGCDVLREMADFVGELDSQKAKASGVLES